MNIPEEAIKAAEFALREADLDRFGPEKTYANYARAALSAAAPTLMAMAFEQGQKSGLRYADRIRAAMEINRPELPGPPSSNPYRKEQL